MSAAPQDRIRTLLLRSDNLLKRGRTEQARAALEEAREVARDPAVDARLRELVDRRLASHRGQG